MAAVTGDDETGTPLWSETYIQILLTQQLHHLLATLSLTATVKRPARLDWHSTTYSPVKVGCLVVADFVEDVLRPTTVVSATSRLTHYGQGIV